MKRALYAAGFLLAITVFLIGCAGSPRPRSSAAERVLVAEVPSDYFDEEVRLAVLRFFSWEDTVSMAGAYPVTIVVEAGGATGGLAQVEPLFEIKPQTGAADKSVWSWTPFVFGSHRASGSELEVGQWVLCVREEAPLSDDELRNSVFRYVKILSLDELLKGLVQISYYDTYYWEDRSFKVNVQNLRVVENPVAEEALRF